MKKENYGYYGHQKRSRNDSITQINREKNFSPVSSHIQPKLVPRGEKPNPVLIARFIQLQNSKNNRIRYDKRNTARLTARSCRRLSKLKNRQGALSKRLFVFSPNLITDCIKKSWTITRIIALHKRFCKVFGHFSNTCPLASNLSFDQPRPEILHGYLVFF